MKKVCRNCCNGDYPYDTTKIIMIITPFLCMGFILLVTYDIPFFRYSIAFFCIILTVVFGKKIREAITKNMNLRKI